MDLQKLREKMAEDGNDDYGLRDTNAFLANEYFRLNKAKCVEEEGRKRIIDLRLEFPFHPTKVDDKAYNYKRLYVSKLSPTSTVLVIKAEAKDKPALKEMWEGLMPGIIDWNNLELVSETEIEAFKRFRVLDHGQRTITKANLPLFGKFGRKFASNAVKNQYDEYIEKDLAFEIHELELEFAYIENKITEDRMKTEGKTQEEIKKAKSNRMAEVAVKNPYKLGVLRGLEFKANKEGEIEKVADIKDISKFAIYTGGAKDEYSKFSGYLNRTSDKHFDYLEVDVFYNKPVGNFTEQQKALEVYKARDVQAKTDFPVNTQIENFDKLYREYRDNEDYFSDLTLMRSVRDMKPIDDKVLLEAYSEFFTKSNRERLIDSDLSERYHMLLLKVKSDLGETLMNAALDGKQLGKAIDVNYVQVDEDQAGYGISEGDMEDLDIAPIEV